MSFHDYSDYPMGDEGTHQKSKHPLKMGKMAKRAAFLEKKKASANPSQKQAIMAALKGDKNDIAVGMKKKKLGSEGD